MPEVPNATAMKVITKLIENRVMASSNGQVEMFTRVNTRKTKETVTERCIGLMVVAIRESGFVVFNMGTAR